MKKRDEDGQDDGESTSNNVKVFLRVRPFNQRELKIHEEHYDSMLRSIIDMPQGPEGPIHFLEKVGEGDDEDYAVSEVFDFDKGLWSITPEQQPYDFQYASQRTVFDEIGRPALDNAWKGFNTCIFAYGQTGAGKTHTMMGRFTYSDGELHDDPGVIPLLCRDLYESIDSRKKEDETKDNKLSTITYETELMAYEIYNERVRDLFYFHSPGRKAKDELKVRKHPTEGTFVDGITKLKPETWEACISDVEAGNSGRTVGATAMNSESSRSHSVFQIKFTQVETSIPQARYEKPVVNRKYSIINLIDLAGSERNKKSQAAGERLVEATNINLSLTTLKRVIDALVHNGLNPKHPVQIPYRDSVLTMLLSHSLGGNSKTAMVACVSPHYDNSEETLNTLRYASQARRIVNIVRVNEDSKARQNLLLKEQLANLQQELEDRRNGDLSPQQIMELEDEIKAGQESLTAYEAEAKKLRLEKHEEEQKRYHQAFQHSFQMVVMRRQKEEAQRLAKETANQLEKMNEVQKSEVQEARRELSTVRHAADATAEELRQEKAKREQLQTKSIGLQWVEKQRRVTAEKNAAKSLSEATSAHRDEINAIMDEANTRQEELLSKINEKEKENEVLREEVEQMKGSNKMLEAKAEDYRERTILVEKEATRKLSDEQYKHEREMETLRSRLTIEKEEVKRDLEATIQRSKVNEEVVRQEALQKAESIEYNLKAELDRVQEGSEMRRIEAVREMEAQLCASDVRRDEALRKQREAFEEEQQKLKDYYENKLSLHLAKIDDQIQVLNEVSRREVKYRSLSHQLDSALDRTREQDLEAGCSQDLREFLELARSYSAQLISNPINRSSVSRAALPVSAVECGAPPCVGGFEEPTWNEGPASVQTIGNGRIRATSRSPSRRSGRKSGGKSPGSPGKSSPGKASPVSSPPLLKRTR
eukprot:TRINITY_DN4156_c0_g1_i1.p1 TRINITY_DN4156_c0_g1~~TRINITY_DN4156_c0_g1_i1.p1  ORF type:complete len:1040 (+),score=261.65 TRINITY_DN4156_c0_g1_i1:321-3122(+)